MPLEGSKALPKHTTTLAKTLSARNHDPEKCKLLAGTVQ